MSRPAPNDATERTSDSTTDHAPADSAGARSGLGDPPMPTGPESRIYWAVVDCWTIVRREIIHLVREPGIILWQLGFPVVSVLLFVFVFGSAMDVGDGVDFTAYAMPGMFAMTMAFGFMNTAMAVAVDKERGVTDRFRAMPMAPSAVVTGRGVSDLLHAALDLAVLVAIALVVGWRWEGGLLAALAAFGLLLLLRLSLIWVGVLLGLLVKNQESAGNLFAVAFPFGMISSVFTPPHLMPDWLGTVAMWNPVSATADAVRDLFGNPVPHDGSWVATNAMLMAVIWPLLITAVVLPLAVRRYRDLAK